MVHGYDEPETERRLMGRRHELEAWIRSTPRNCLEGTTDSVETFVIGAVYDEALQFIGTVRGADESVPVEYRIVPVDRTPTQINEE